jgi:hypothetical protein
MGPTKTTSSDRLASALLYQTDTMAISGLRGLRFVSFFNYGYEALIINELAGQKIHDFPVRWPLHLFMLSSSI